MPNKTKYSDLSLHRNKWLQYIADLKKNIIIFLFYITFNLENFCEEKQLRLQFYLVIKENL
jgi:hypothetical protein